MAQLNDDQIAKLEEQLIAQAPDGLSESAFNEWLSSRMNEAIAAAEPKERTWTDTAVDLLPAAGATTAALLTGGASLPVMAGAAALGGATGGAAKILTNLGRGKRVPTMGEAAKDIASSGAIEGGTQVVGGLAAKGLSRAGHALYRGLLKPTNAVVAKYGDVVPGLIERNRLITAGGRDASKAAQMASKQAADDIIADASGRTPFIRSGDATSGFGEVRDRLARRAMGGQTDETGKVADRVLRLRRTMDAANNGLGMDVVEANAVKRELDAAVNGAQQSVRRGFSGQLSSDDLLNDATRKSLASKIDQMTGVGPQNAMTRTLAGETTALRDAVKRTQNNLAVGPRDAIAAMAGMGAGVGTGDSKMGAGAGILARLLMSPRAGSAAAIGLVKGGRLSPAALRALRELMMSHDGGGQ